jgi:Protein of unknown function DUF262
LLKDIRLGKVQLPDFQREWKWDDERIRSLLATISLGYPIGVVMTLETGGEGARFKPKLVAGVDGSADLHGPEQLLLDGQQRLTSLYQSLISASAVDTMDTRGKRLRRWYYIDIEQALGDESDREAAIIGVPEDRVLREDFGRAVRADYSSPQGECDAGMFPFRLAFDSDGTLDWAWAYTDGNEQRRTIWKAFKSSILDNITSYLIPVIKLTKQTPKEAVGMVFEKVNTGGVPLNVFELLTATYAGDPGYFRDHGADFRLKDYWAEVQVRLSRYPVLHDLESTDFLQAVTLLSTFSRRRHSSDSRTTAPGVSCKRESILALPLADFLTWGPPSHHRARMGRRVPGSRTHLRRPGRSLPLADSPAGGHPRGRRRNRISTRARQQAAALVLVRGSRRALQRHDGNAVRPRPRANTWLARRRARARHRA